MLGNNPLRPPINGDGKFLALKNIFKTLQGEGPNTGVPSVFIRLGGCNLACNFCDTEFEDYSECSIEDIINKVEELSLNNVGKRSINLVVITGGEPLRQPIDGLCQDLLKKGFKVQIETNGTLYRDLPQEVEIICSPKVSNGRYYKLREDLLKKVKAFKFLVSAQKSEYSNVPEIGQNKFNIPVYVQAMDELNEERNVNNRKLAVEIAINSGYRLSYQIHKELGIE